MSNKKKKANEEKTEKTQNQNSKENKKTKENNKDKKTSKIKENKKNTNETENQNNSSNEMAKLLKIVLIVTGIMIIFYGITLVATNKADETKEKETKESKKEETQIQYENIMIGSMLSHDGTYYVLIEQKDDNRLAEYDSLITTIKSSEDAPTIYKANLKDAFNKDYLGKEANYYVDDMADFKVTGTTLVKVKDGKIDSVSDNHDAIKNKLNDLA